MKQQVSRLSPHQNGKVAAVLMTISSTIFVVPLLLLGRAFGSEDEPPVLMIVLMPLLYFILGYIMVAATCWFYNSMVRFVGGIEFESKAKGG